MADLICGCPEDFRLNDYGICEDVTSQAPIENGDELTVTAVSNNSNYSVYGAYIFDTIDNRPGPITQTGIGPDSVETRDSLSQDLEIGTIISTLPWTNRLSTVGVWTSIAPNPLDEWIGFSFCIPTEEEKTYYIGFGSTTHVRITLNGLQIYLSQHTSSPAYKRWQIIPITFPIGDNTILFEALNPSGTAAMGMEVYNATSTELENATSSNLISYVVASTQGRVGDIFDSGADTGYSCNPGFRLENCSGVLRCVQREVAEVLPCCMILTNCQNPAETLSTNTDLLEHLGEIVKIDLYPGCWILTTSTLPCEEVNEVALVGAYSTCEDCIPVDEVCYTLTNCEDDKDTMQVKGVFAGYIGQIVKLENFEGCWEVSESVVPCIPITEVEIIDYFSICAACLPSDCCKPKPCCNECL